MPEMIELTANLSTGANRKGRGPLALTEAAYAEAVMLIERNEPADIRLSDRSDASGHRDVAELILYAPNEPIEADLCGSLAEALAAFIGEE